MRGVFFGLATAVLLLPVTVMAQWPGAEDYSGDSGLTWDTPIIELVTTAMKWLLYAFGFFAIIAFVVSGIKYLMAAGDESSAEGGKKGMMNSIIGVLVALLGLIIVNAVENYLSADERF